MSNRISSQSVWTCFSLTGWRITIAICLCSLEKAARHAVLVQHPKRLLWIRHHPGKSAQSKWSSAWVVSWTRASEEISQSQTLPLLRVLQICEKEDTRTFLSTLGFVPSHVYWGIISDFKNCNMKIVACSQSLSYSCGRAGDYTSFYSTRGREHPRCWCERKGVMFAKNI